MNITEEQLNNIIREQIEKYLIEYTDPRNRFIDRADDLLPQLIENWCLVHYCTLMNTDINQCKNHWKSELRNIIFQMGIKKVGNNKPQIRHKAFIEAFDRSNLLDDVEMAYISCIGKFEKENISWENNDIYQQCINDLISHKENIVNILVNFNKNDIIDYINKI